jgi:hypothetical protein
MSGRGAAGIAVGAGLALAACNPIFGPSHPDANWHVFETARFSLHVRPGSFAEQNQTALGAVLEDQYTVTIATLDMHMNAHISGFLYNSASETDLSGDHSGVAYPDTSAFRAVCVPPLDANLFSLISHEANHVIIDGGLGHPGTYMMNEGLASAVLSERFHNQGRHFYYAWTKAHRAQIPPMSRLVDDSEWNHVAHDVAYSASASFLAYLLETQGPSRLRQVFYADSENFASRFSEAYGRTLEAVEADWLAFCDRS